MAGRAALWIILLWIVCAGCGARSDLRQTGQRPFEDYGKLPWLSRTDYQPLREELARIEAEGGTPLQLSETSIPDADNVATILRDAWPASELGTLAAQSEALLPPPGEPLSGAALERAARFCTQHEAAQLRIREALRRRACEFAVNYSRGFAADLSFVDAAIVYTRLELLTAGEQAALADPAAALEPFASALRMIDHLSHVRLLEPRLQAAFLRFDALQALGWIVRSENAARDVYDRLYELLTMQFATWAPDELAWIGDRALGLHTYELIRDGRVTWLLTDEERETLDAEGLLGPLRRPDPKRLAADALFYLQTMRAMVELCRVPYYKRRAFFANLRADLQERKDEPDFPIVAARILLADIENGHQIQARDRARCEAACLALAAAAGREKPAFQRSPFTGEPYRIVAASGQVTVWNAVDSQQSGEVPLTIPALAEPSALEPGGGPEQP